MFLKKHKIFKAFIFVFLDFKSLSNPTFSNVADIVYTRLKSKPLDFPFQGNLSSMYTIESYQDAFLKTLEITIQEKTFPYKKNMPFWLKNAGKSKGLLKSIFSLVTWKGCF